MIMQQGCTNCTIRFWSLSTISFLKIVRFFGEMAHSRFGPENIQEEPKVRETVEKYYGHVERLWD